MTTGFLLFSFLLTSTYGDYYDFKQTGETNLHFDIKDITIYGIGDLDYAAGTQDDYVYDYTDLTVKPETSSTTSGTSQASTEPPSVMSTTVSSSTTVVASSTTTKVPPTTLKKTTTAYSPSTTSKPVALLASENNTVTITNQNKENITTDSNKTPANAGGPINAENYQIPVVVITDGKKGYVSSSSIRRKDEEENAPAPPGRKCLHGFYLDSRNRCKPISRKPMHPKEKPRLANGLRYAQRPGTEKPE